MPDAKLFLSLDASIKDMRQQREAVKLDVAENRILFEFPSGFSQIPLIEECRALNRLDDFDLMYDITMQLITGKPVMIYLRDYKGEKHLFEKFVCTDRYMDLRGVDKINSYPIIVNWLVSFVAEHLSKKYPRPSEIGLHELVSEKKNQKPANKTI